MLAPEPLWTYCYAVRGEWGPLTSIDAALSPRYAASASFAVERATGRELWRTEKPRASPNKTVAIDGDVLVGTRFVWDGPAAYRAGTYLIDLRTGAPIVDERQLPPGPWGRVLGWLRERTERATSPGEALLVLPGEAWTEYGKVIDTRTGAVLRSAELSREERDGLIPVESRFTRDRSMECGDLGRLCAGVPEEPELPRASFGEIDHFQVYLRGPSERIEWRFRLLSGENGYSRLHDWRYLHPFAYLLVAEEQTPGGSSRERERCGLWCLDLRTGEVRQRVRIHGDWASYADIEDADEEGVLVKWLRLKPAEYHLAYFPRPRGGDSERKT